MVQASVVAPEPPPLSGLSLALAGVVLALANFVVVLDVTIANVSVPHISGSLAVAPSQGTWIITSYAVAEAISVPLTGWLAGRFGAVRVFIAAMTGFALFSFLCGLAPNLFALIVSRVFQGLFGGPIMPMSQTLMLRVFPRERAAAAFGLWSMTTVVAPIAGPILGGVISDNWSWPWIFFINLPVIALSVVLSVRLLRAHETPTAKAPIDYVGLGLLVVWVAALQILLDEGRDADWFASGFIVALAVTAVIGFLAFLIWEITEAHPIVDLRVFLNRGFAVGTIAQGLGFAAFFAQIVLIPLWLQTNLGYTATWAGYATAFLGVLAVVMSPVAATLVARTDVRAVITFGILWLAGVTFMRATWITNIDFFGIALPQLAQGFGMPFFFIGTMALALGAVKPDQASTAAGALNFVRTLAGAFATSLGTTAWEHGAKVHRAELSGVLNQPAMTIETLMRAGLGPEQARATLARLVDAEAMTLSANEVFLGCVVLFLIAAAIVWLAPRPRADVDLSASH